MATLKDYTQYTKSLDAQNTTPTGFLEFSPRDPVSQSKYSAMSSSWEGVQSSEKAIARGDYDLDRAEKNRQDLRSKTPPSPPPPAETTCSIQ